MLKTHPNVTLYSTKNCQSRKQVLWKSFSFCAKNKKGRKTLGVNTCASHLWIFITLLNKNISKYDSLSINQFKKLAVNEEEVFLPLRNYRNEMRMTYYRCWNNELTFTKNQLNLFFFPKQSGYWIRRGLIFLLGVNRIFYYLFLSLQNSDNIITPTKSISSFLLSSIKDFPLSLSLAIIFLSFVF